MKTISIFLIAFFILNANTPAFIPWMRADSSEEERATAFRPGEFIILKSGVQIQECNIRTSLQVIPPKIWYEQAIDGSSQNRLLTRVLHNKAGIFINEASGCYLNFLSPVFIYQAVGLFGVFFWVYFAYRAILKNQRMIILILLMLPLIPVASANGPTYLFGLGLISNLYKLIAFIGLITFFKKDK